MAPNFLSKFVKVATPTHARDRSDRSLESPRSSNGSTSPSVSRSRTASSAGYSSFTQSTAPTTPAPTSSKLATDSNLVPTISVQTNNNNHSSLTLDTFDDSTSVNVTVVPPSPLVHTRSLTPSESSHSDRQVDGLPSSGTGDFILSSAPRGRTTTVTTHDDSTPVQSPTTPRPSSRNASRSRPPPPSTSTHNVVDKKQPPPPLPTSSPAANLEPGREVRKQPSNKSLNNQPAQMSAHSRAATAPDPGRRSAEEQNGTYATMNPIVESPTALRAPEFPDPVPVSSSTSENNSVTPNGSANNSSSMNLSPRDNSDNKSIMSTATTNGSGEKKRPWRRSSTNQRKPTGLASAIAASGLAMANPTISPAQQAMHQAQIASPPLSTSTSRKSSNPGSPPYLSRSPPGSSSHVKGRSADLSPRSTRSKRSGSGSGRTRTPSISVASDQASEYYAEDRPEYYSGLDEGSSDEDGSEDEEDDLMDLDLGEDDIPVTGFAVASNKRNADFHELFPSIPEGDYLIEDYGCALQREILIQGRIYISENHICFHANIFGWITDLSIPIYEITSLEKKMTAFVIPNAIQITTRQSKYSFASFLSRDTTYDVIYNIWRLARPDDLASIASGSVDHHAGESVSALAMQTPRAGVQGPGAGGGGGAQAAIKKATQCTCGKEGKHYTETAMDSVLPGAPERINNLMFASGFMKDFMAVNQKLLDIQVSDWQPTAPGSTLLTRNMSYIKPLNGSLGPKQTKCEIRDEMVYCNFDEYVSTITTTRTPDVPSGGVFSVKTRTCVMWASAVSSRVVVTTEVEWTGRSFIKGIIERSAIDGQKVYHGELEKAMRAYIQEHQSEFIPEGIDVEAIAAAETAAVTPPVEEIGTKPLSELTEEEKKQREHERNRRGLQWAWDTFEGASEVAKRSTKGALELVTDAWEQSTSTTILWFVIVLLVFSNLWTLTRVGSREQTVRRKEMKKVEEREKWVQSVVTALWDELSAGKREAAGQTHVGGGGGGAATPSIDTALPPQVPSQQAVMTAPGNWKKEVEYLHHTLDSVEERVKAIRASLAGLESLNDMD